MYAFGIPLYCAFPSKNDKQISLFRVVFLDSDWNDTVFCAGGLDYKLTEGDVLAVFSQ